MAECEDVGDPEDPNDKEGSFGFMVHVLDEKDTVLTLTQEPVTTRAACFEYIEDIKRILKSGKRIYIGGHGKLDDPREKEEFTYSSFGKKGTFYGNGRVLQLSVVQNELGKCYRPWAQPYDPCMPEEFAARRKERAERLGASK